MVCRLTFFHIAKQQEFSFASGSTDCETKEDCAFCCCCFFILYVLISDTEMR